MYVLILNILDIVSTYSYCNVIILSKLVLFSCGKEQSPPNSTRSENGKRLLVRFVIKFNSVNGTQIHIIPHPYPSASHSQLDCDYSQPNVMP